MHPDLMYPYSEEEIKQLRNWNILVPDGREFAHGKDCPGKEPFGESQECYQNCYGIKGLFLLTKIAPPCTFSTVKPFLTSLKKKEESAISIGGTDLFEKNMTEGISGL